MDDSWDLLKLHISECKDCPWKNIKKQTVLPEGPLNSPVFFIGRNPGYQEDKLGRPFVGPSGKALNKFLLATGIDRSKVWITNVVKCQGGLGDPCPTDEVYECCKPWLVREVKLFKPKLLVTLGNDSFCHVSRLSGSSVKLQGELIPMRSPIETSLFVMTHPSYWIRNPKYFANTVMKEMTFRLRQVLSDLGIDNVGLDIDLTSDPL